MEQMAILQKGAFASISKDMPDYHALPGLPLRTQVKYADQPEITSTIESISLAPLPDSGFHRAGRLFRSENARFLAENRSRLQPDTRQSMTSGLRPRFILASASPRRRQLLADAGFEFEVVAPEVDEVSSTNLTLREATSWNALRKGLAVARAHPDAVVLAADTLVALGHQVIGKPADRVEAARILRLLSGRTHVVARPDLHRSPAPRQIRDFCVTSRVVFKKLSDRMIEEYLARIDPLDKAGAYAAQGEDGTIIARIIGSRSNVIGLPLEKTSGALARFGIRRADAQRLTNFQDFRSLRRRRAPFFRRSRRRTR